MAFRNLTWTSISNEYTVSFSLEKLDDHSLNVRHSVVSDQEQFEELCFDYGLELDDIVSSFVYYLVRCSVFALSILDIVIRVRLNQREISLQTSEKQSAEKEKGAAAGEKLSDVEVS